MRWFPWTSDEDVVWASRFAVIIGVLLVLNVDAAAADNETAFPSQSQQQQQTDVTILGLGKMGVAVVECLSSSSLSSKQQTVIHAWNRGAAKREAVRSVAHIYEFASDAIRASNLTLILIDDWNGTVQLLKEMKKEDLWKNMPQRTVVLFSTYTPTDIQTLQLEMFTSNTTASQLVGGAIVGVPQTICSQQALILTTAEIPVLTSVGRVVAFPSRDVGGAALANIALILVITFGIAGQELAHLIIRQYFQSLSVVDPADDTITATSTKNEVSISNMAEFVKIYAPLAADIGPAYTKMLLPMVSKAIASKEYDRSYVPVGVFRRVLQMHAAFMDDLGIANDTFLTSYIRYLEKIDNNKFGPAAWIEHAATQNQGEQHLEDIKRFSEEL